MHTFGEMVKIGLDCAKIEIILVLNKVDLVEDKELLELIEMEIRELLTFYKFDGENTPVIFGSALAGLNGTTDG